MILRNPTTLHNPLAAYSHQAEVDGNAKWLVMSAQVGMDKDGYVPDDVYAQTKIAMGNIMLNLYAAKMSKENLVKLTFYFVGSHDILRRRDIVNNALGDHKPCMTVIYVAGLATPDLKVEIDAWAVKADAR